MLDLESVLGTPQPDTLVYCCGPEGLLHAVEKFCEKWPPGALHLERFSAKPQEPAAEVDSSFELVLERSGLTLQVPPDKSVLDGHPRGRRQRSGVLSGRRVRNLRDRGHRRRC